MWHASMCARVHCAQRYYYETRYVRNNNTYTTYIVFHVFWRVCVFVFGKLRQHVAARPPRRTLAIGVNALCCAADTKPHIHSTTA